MQNYKIQWNLLYLRQGKLNTLSPPTLTNLDIKLSLSYKIMRKAGQFIRSMMVISVLILKKKKKCKTTTTPSNVFFFYNESLFIMCDDGEDLVCSCSCVYKQ